MGCLWNLWLAPRTLIAAHPKEVSCHDPLFNIQRKWMGGAICFSMWFTHLLVARSQEGYHETVT